VPLAAPDICLRFIGVPNPQPSKESQILTIPSTTSPSCTLSAFLMKSRTSRSLSCLPVDGIVTVRRADDGAIIRTKEAIDQGKQGHAKVLATHASAALKHAMAAQREHANPQIKEGITHLKAAIASAAPPLLFGRKDAMAEKKRTKASTGRAEVALRHLEQALRKPIVTRPIVPSSAMRDDHFKNAPCTSEGNQC
jgi:hypothetical protein